MSRSSALLIALIFTINSYVFAQLDNQLFYDCYAIQNSDSGSIKLGFDISGYFWNNEYATDIAPGYTLFGYQFKPYVSYYPSNRFRIDAGGFFMKDFGDSSFTDIRPVLTLKYKKNNFSFLFGTLEGAASHRLIEPLYYLQRVISRRLEDGFQFKWLTDRLFLDIWLDWENMIRFGDDENEAFNAGFSFAYQIFKSRIVRIEIPFQFLAHHTGGQIDANNLPAETQYNSGMGLGLLFPFHGISWLNHIKTENYFVDYFTSETPQVLPYGQGYGIFLNASGSFKWFDLMISYWYGNQFIAHQGTPIYQSVSMDFIQSGYVEKERKLLFLRLMYERNLTRDLSLAFRFEPVYDFGSNKMDHMELLYLRYNTDFILNKKKLK